MANTYEFTSVTNGQAKFKKNSEFWHIIEEEDKLDQTGASRMRMFNHNGQYDIDLAVDTVIINGTTYAPGSNFDTVYDALNPLFHKANTGTGGPGEGGIPNPMTGNYTLDANSFKYKVVSADETLFEAANAFVSLSQDSASIGVNGETNVSLEVTPAGVVINNNGTVSAVGGGGLTLASPDGSIWGLTVTNADAMNPMKLAESGEGGTVHVFAANDTEWNVTISNEGVLSTTQI